MGEPDLQRRVAGGHVDAAGDLATNEATAAWSWVIAGATDTGAPWAFRPAL